MKYIHITTLLLIILIISCTREPTTIVEDDISIAMVDIGERSIMIAESLNNRHGLIWLGCGEFLTEGFCDKCRRGQIRDMANNKPMRDCRTACKTKNCNAPIHEDMKMFVMQK